MTSDELLKRDVRGILFLLLPFPVIGLIAIGLFSISRTDELHAFATSLTVSIGCAAVGAVIGFIFAVPRALIEVEAAPNGAAPATQRGYRSNSNLEQISDWLTKLLLGASLAQAGEIFEGLKKLANLVAGEFQPATGNVGFSGSLIVFFTVFGFFFSYLLTRRVLPVVFRRADEDGAVRIREVSGKIDSAFNTLARSKDTDAAAEVAEKKFGPAVDAVANVPRREVQPRDLATWAQAKMIKGDHLAATDALIDAKKETPDDPKIAEMLVFSALYNPPPEGFERAIAAGEAVKEQSPWLHAYLAAAYGQKHKWAQEHQQDVNGPRENVLRHVKAAVGTGDSVVKTLLQNLLKPPAGSSEDDLASLKGDQELEKLLA